MWHCAIGLVSISLKFFFLLTPFFVLSMFLAVTSEYSATQRKILAFKVVFAALVACLVLLFFGRWIFAVFGITVDAFRIGGGALLFLSAVQLVNGAAGKVAQEAVRGATDISVVPLAIPVTVGPATTGALLVIGASIESFADLMMTAGGLLIAHALLLLILSGSNLLERILRQRGIVILSKLTGLILAALASEMIFTGIKAILKD